MAIGYILLLLVTLILFLALFPDRHRIARKFKRVISFKEVTFIHKKLDELEYSSTEEEIKKKIDLKVYSLKSDYTKEEMEYDVMTPVGLHKQDVKRVLILLHGIRDSKENWRSKAKILENYLDLFENKQVEEMVFVAPGSGFNGESFYTNFYHLKEFRYEEYFSKEFIPLLKNRYPKAKFGIVGFSMGGYGAYKLGLKNSENFSVVGSISGAVSLVRMILNRRVFRIFKYIYIPKFLFNSFDQQHFMRVFGPQGGHILREDPYSIMKVMERDKILKLKFYASVGSEDKKPYLMVQQWLDVVGRMKKLKLDFKAYVYKDEVHTWEYVSKDLRNFLRFFYNNTKE
ncbi:MAG: alpha/beta hydrolase [Fusobacteriaceae bacterium]